MTDTTDTTDRKEYDIGTIMRRHRAIVRAADAYTRGKITWNNYALIASQFGDIYASLARTMPGVRLGGSEHGSEGPPIL